MLSYREKESQLPVVLPSVDECLPLVVTFGRRERKSVTYASLRLPYREKESRLPTLCFGSVGEKVGMSTLGVVGCSFFSNNCYLFEERSLSYSERGKGRHRRRTERSPEEPSKVRVQEKR